MKKLITIIMCLLLLLPVVNVKAEENNNDNFVESFEIVGLEDGKVNSGDTLNLHVKLKDVNEEFTALGVVFAFKGKHYSEETFWFDMNFNGNGTYVGKYEINDNFKYRYEQTEFQYIEFFGEYGEEMDQVKIATFSHLDYEDITYPGSSDHTYKCKDYSFVVEDSDLDTEGPTLAGDIELKLENHTISASVPVADDKLKVTNCTLQFTTDSLSYPISMYLYDDSETGKIKGEGRDIYRHYPYGTYTLSSITLYDENDNESIIDTELPNLQFELKKEDNVLENLTVEDITLVSGNYLVTDKIEIAKDTGYGRTFFNLYYLFGEGSEYLSEDIQLTSGNIDVSKIDISKTGMTNYEYTFEYPINYYENDGMGRSKELTIIIPIEVVDVIGEIVWPSDGFEYYLNYEDYPNVNYDLRPLWELVKKETFAYIYETQKVERIEAEEGGYSFAGIGGTTLSSTFMSLSGGYIFSPKYIDKEQPGKYDFAIPYRIYLVNKKGDLVDMDGKTIVKYKDRVKKEIKDLTSDVRIFAMEGSLPSYTQVNAKENKNLDNVFDSSYFAYDITLETDYEDNIQPLGEVEVTLPLGDEFKNEDLEVYYVDDQGNKELIDSKVENGEITFVTDHFSTYAVVVKEDKTSGTTTPNKPAEPALPNKPTEPTVPNKPIDSNTSGPNTADHSGLSTFFSLLISSAFIALTILKKER